MLYMLISKTINPIFIQPNWLGLQNTLSASLLRSKNDECPGYNTESFDGEAPVLEPITLRLTLTWSGSTC